MIREEVEEEYVGNLNLNIIIVASQAYVMHRFAKLIVLYIPFSLNLQLTVSLSLMCTI
jgi:hypothetical protein